MNGVWSPEASTILIIRDKASEAVKRVKGAWVWMGEWNYFTFRCWLRPGLYSCSVIAVDPAGNTFPVPHGSALRVTK